VNIFVLSLVPLVLLSSALVFVNDAQPRSIEGYLHYHEFWGGSPTELFSHWLDMIVMSGNAFSLGWFLTLEAFARKKEASPRTAAWPNRMLAICAVGVTVAAAMLDRKSGEGTVIFVAFVVFLPVLVSWYYLLRRLASVCNWILSRVLIIAVLFGLLNLLAQLVYEPSSSGGPNDGFIPVWIGSVGAAFLIAVVWPQRKPFLRETAYR
jgi:hypothetical protein